MGQSAQRLVLVTGVALDHRNQIRDQVVAHHQLGVDARECVVEGIAPAHKQVVRAGHGKRDEYHDADDLDNGHEAKGSVNGCVFASLDDPPG